MVTLSPPDKQAIASAVTEAESKTAVEIVVVIAKASDAYLHGLLLIGLTLGTLVALGLWLTLPIAFPWLILTQWAITGLFCFFHPLSRRCIVLMPNQVKKHRVEQRACLEYMTAYQALPPGAPLVVLYLSQAERYAHIMVSRSIQAALPLSTWDALVAGFTKAVPEHSLVPSCLKLIRKCADSLSPVFPRTNETHRLPDQLIER